MKIQNEDIEFRKGIATNIVGSEGNIRQKQQQISSPSAPDS